MTPAPHELADRITRRLSRGRTTGDIRALAVATGGCSKPVHLSGHRTLTDLSGTVLTRTEGTVYAPCGNRRDSVCPACSDRYQADAFHLIRAGMCGGKTIPTDVADKPRLFVTVTAPSFGTVHTRRQHRRTGRPLPCPCGEYHHPADPRLGTATDPDRYDYRGAVLWQGHAGDLWQRTMIRLRRALATAAGLRVKDFPDHARLSYAKVAEYQKRGTVHFHALFRLDGPDGPDDPAPAWATAELIEHAIRTAVETAEVTTRLILDGTPDVHTFRWGTQLDIRAIRPEHAPATDDTGGEISDRALAGYIAKYATKGTSTSEAADRPMRSELDIDALTIHSHHKAMIRTAWDLGTNPDLAFLRKWAHMLGFRGHFLTKSQRYSLTFKTIRGQRAEYRRAESITATGHDPNSVLVINDWRHTGSGYNTPAERELAEAIYARKRQHRKEKYTEENTP
ncbi:replication initiation protein [Amycolatopsis antarctica]|uniref:Replication initiation protein n=1 Tax=Amycolatopsis antarctica TaxID=1854586 RepID=A0A263D837_9PSEU|nr:replication initiator [Amycolatopsis antarctica]OZM73565.1 replication initiation protein [Amycolatopsis antarctica]